MRWLVLTFLVIVWSATRASACVCGGGRESVKQAWQRAPFVFLGTVELADPEDAQLEAQFVRIQVDEPFKGVTQGQAIELHQGNNDCEAKFRTGRRYVLYLDEGNTPDSMVLPACAHGVGSVDPAGDDLLFLEGLPKSAIGTRLSGEVEWYEESPTDSFHRIGGLPTVHITAWTPTGERRHTETNSAGVFEILGLAPGTWFVSIDVPKNLKVKFASVAGSKLVRGVEPGMKLEPDGSASVSYVLEDDTRISGRVLDSKGAPINNICVYLEAVGGRSGRGARPSGCSKKDTSVATMAMMSPGEYFLVTHDTVEIGGVKSESTVYYPGVRDREQAKPITVEAGKYAENIEIRLPADNRYKITGHFQFNDGVPGPHTTVTFTSPQHGYSETTQTKPDGSFVLSVVAGMEGQLTARVYVTRTMSACLQDKNLNVLEALPVVVSGDSDQENIILELPSPSCN